MADPGGGTDDGTVRATPWTALVAAAALLAGCTTAPPAAATASPARSATSPGPSTARATVGSAVSAESSPPRSAPAARPTPERPCVGTPPPRRWAHVVWVVMENRDPAQIVGSPQAPFETALAAQCGLAVRYSAVAHPSLPNYLALTSGSTHGVSDDAGPDQHPIAGPSVFSLLAAAGLDWATYAESMPAPCFPSSTASYAVKHNPAVYYTGLRASCASADLPMGSPAAGALATALDTGRLPAFSLLVPNICNDDHDCPVSTGDAWLSRWLPRLTASAAYRAGETAVFVTWDEAGAGTTNAVALLVVAPSVPAGTTVAVPASHVALLATTLALLGVANPITPPAPAMARGFHLA